MILRKLPYLLLFFIGLSHASAAAEDNQIWSSARLRYISPQNVKVDLIQHLRWDQNASSFLSAMPELRMKLSPSDGASVGIGYRLIHKRSGSGDFESAHRVQLNGEIERSFGQLSAAYRLQGQTRYEPDAQRFDTSLRNRVALTVDTSSKFTPLLSVESFVDHTDEGLQNSHLRSSLGTAVKISKPHRFKVRYHHDVSLDGSSDIERILVMDYQYRYKASSD